MTIFTMRNSEAAKSAQQQHVTERHDSKMCKSWQPILCRFGWHQWKPWSAPELYGMSFSQQETFCGQCNAVKHRIVDGTPLPEPPEKS